MFTGLVEALGEVVEREATADGARLVIRAALEADDVRLGDSIAVNGCCLTVAAAGPRGWTFDLLAETLRRTNLGSLHPGARVNVERALSAQGRLGGHFVQGHIDGTGAILALDPVGADYRLEIALPPEQAVYVIPKGSICVDGISLTVAELGSQSCTIWLIPHTMAQTNLQDRRAGERVNLEFDLLAKYVERLVAGRLDQLARG